MDHYELSGDGDGDIFSIRCRAGRVEGQEGGMRLRIMLIQETEL